MNIELHSCDSTGTLKAWQRSDPIQLSRALTAAINHYGAQQEGILTGNWSGDFQGEGERPTDPSAPWVSKE